MKKNLKRKCLNEKCLIQKTDYLGAVLMRQYNEIHIIAVCIILFFLQIFRIFGVKTYFAFNERTTFRD